MCRYVGMVSLSMIYVMMETHSMETDAARAVRYKRIGSALTRPNAL